MLKYWHLITTAYQLNVPQQQQLKLCLTQYMHTMQIIYENLEDTLWNLHSLGYSLLNRKVKHALFHVWSTDMFCFVMFCYVMFDSNNKKTTKISHLPFHRVYFAERSTFRQLYLNLLLIFEPSHQIYLVPNLKHQISWSLNLLSSKGACDSRIHCGKTLPIFQNDYEFMCT